MASLQNSKDIKYYNYGEVITPYQLPTQEWDFSLGRLQASAAKWRYAAIITLCVSVLFALLFILLLSFPKQRVFAVQTTKNGFVSEVYRLDQRYQVPESLYHQFIHRYLNAVLSITLNTNQNRRDQLYAQWFGSKKVIKTLRAETIPLSSGQRRLIRIRRIDSLPPSKKGMPRYRVTWQQGRLMPGQGEPKQLQQRQAIFTIGYRMPAHKRQVLINPFGFYVQDVTGLNQQYAANRSEKHETAAATKH